VPRRRSLVAAHPIAGPPSHLPDDERSPQHPIHGDLSAHDNGGSRSCREDSGVGPRRPDHPLLSRRSHGRTGGRPAGRRPVPQPVRRQGDGAGTVHLRVRPDDRGHQRARARDRSPGRPGGSSHRGARNLLDYAQESGRAGRDDEASEAILLQHQPIGRRPAAESEPLQQYLGADYRRTVLNGYLDGHGGSEGCAETMIPCDLCAARRTSPAVGRPASLPCVLPTTRSETARAQQGRFVRQEAQQETKEKQIRMEKGLRLLPYFRDQCMLCRVVRSQRHAISACPAPDRGAYDEMAQLIGRTIRYGSCAGCFRCGLPQSLCERWTSTDQGFHIKAGGKCQFRTSLSEAGAVFLSSDARFDRVREPLQKEFDLAKESSAVEPTERRNRIIRQFEQKV
jgi:hypothetical protein